MAKSPAERLAAKKPKRRRGRDTTRNFDVLVCKVRECRESLGLTIADVRDATGLTQATLSVVERGAMTQMDTAQTLARFYGCTVDDLWPLPPTPRGSAP